MEQDKEMGGRIVEADEVMGGQTAYPRSSVYVLWCGFARSDRAAREGELSAAFIGGLYSSRRTAILAVWRYRLSLIGALQGMRLRYWIGKAEVGVTNWPEGFVDG